jgi:hypothetical protein
MYALMAAFCQAWSTHISTFLLTNCITTFITALLFTIHTWLAAFAFTSFEIYKFYLTYAGKVVLNYSFKHMEYEDFH